jgi:4-hydroxy-tetrahydrodipicolinate synthase
VSDGAEFIQLSGDDLTALPAWRAHGCISVVATRTRLCADLQNACSPRLRQSAGDQDRLTPLHRDFSEAGVTGAKYGLSLLGKAEEEVRLPLVPCAQPTKDRIRAAMIHAGVLPA